MKLIVQLQVDRENGKELIDAKNAEAKSSRKRRSSNPKITSITPRNASPNGGVLITIFGENLKSKQIDIGGVASESEDQGENFKVRRNPYDKK